MGRNEDFFPEYVRDEKAAIERRKAYEERKAAALLKEEERKKKEREEEEEIKTAPIERKEAFDFALKSAINNASIEITTTLFGEMTFKNQSETQTQRFNIKIAITKYLDENPQIKEGLFEKTETERLKGDMRVKFLTERLVVIYNNNKQLNSDKSLSPNEEVTLGPDEKKEMIAVVRSVVETYLSEAPQKPSFYTERSKKEFITIMERNKSKEEAMKFLMFLAVKFFKKNKRVPHENELLDMVHENLVNTK